MKALFFKGKRQKQTTYHAAWNNIQKNPHGERSGIPETLSIPYYISHTRT